MKKIVIIGPESTGKSTLCEQLATQYNSLWCPEYAREYLLKFGTNYSYGDLLTIARGQIALEDRYMESVTGNGKFESERAALGHGGRSSQRRVCGD